MHDDNHVESSELYQQEGKSLVSVSFGSGISSLLNIQDTSSSSDIKNSKLKNSLILGDLKLKDKIP